MTFYAVELDIAPGYGWQGGPRGQTRITRMRNGSERRKIERAVAEHSFTLPFTNISSVEYLQYLKAAHMAMYAMAHSFLVKDWLDFEAVDEPIGEAPAGTAAVQLIKTYGFGPALRTRNITNPVAGAVVYQDTGGGPVAKAGTLDTLTGLFTPASDWTEGADLSWSGEFRVKVRFNNDYLPMTIDERFGSDGPYATNGSVELVEVLFD